MELQQRLDAANVRLAQRLQHACVSKWPGGRFIAIVQEPGRAVPLRFLGTSPEACVDAALRQLLGARA